MHLLVLAATGGLASPLLPVLFAGAHNAALFGGSRAARTVFALHIGGLWALLAIHLSGVVQMVPKALIDTGFPGPTFLIMLAFVLSAALSAAHLMGLRTREAVDEQLEQALLARAAALGNYRERADELTTLSAEIAHELKNPLATVKGLAALLSREAKGKDAERVAVLRREVDRMQGILDEFLNFSRPLAPLTVRRVDLGKLGREVMDLHEGIASERMISLSLQVGTHVGVVCDARKVKQILVNLLQNALDAARPDTQIDLVVRRTGTGRQLGESVEVHVLDRGTGVPAALAERIFEAGMTTKPTGNGLVCRWRARWPVSTAASCGCAIARTGRAAPRSSRCRSRGPRIFDGEPRADRAHAQRRRPPRSRDPGGRSSVREPRFDGALGVAT